MKAQSPAIYSVAAIVLVVLVAMILFTLAGGTAKGFAGIDPLKERQFSDNKASQLKELESIYSTFKSNDKNNEGFDSFEASFLIAKVIEYTWKDCRMLGCKDAGDIPEFTNFFIEHPIKLGKTLDCDYVNNEYPSGFPIKKASIRGLCADSDVFDSSLLSKIVSKAVGVDSKTERADEWTVTMWGLLKYTNLCSGYIVDGELWGNGNCGDSDNFVNTDKKCASACAKAGARDWVNEITSDRIRAWSGEMNLGKIYSNIKVTYTPDCTMLKGKFDFIPFAGTLFNLKQPCSVVEIGEGTTNPTVPFYGSTEPCFYGAACPAQNPPVNPPYESQCPAFSSYDGGNGATVCLYGTKCCGSEAYCAGTLSGSAQPTPGGCVQEKCQYKNSQVCTSGETCSAAGCGGKGTGGSVSGGLQCPAVSGTAGYTCTDSSTCSKFGGCSISGKCPTPGEICCKQPPC